MSNEKSLLHCTFGWGKTCRLFLDSIEIAGKAYNLDDLTSIRPTYRTVLGVPSARLELCFGPERLVLRGIPDREIARLMVTHLQPYCADKPSFSRARSRSLRPRDLVKAQAKAWERTSKLPAIPASPPEKDCSLLLSEKTRRSQALSFDEENAFARTCSALLSLEDEPEAHNELFPLASAPLADEQDRTDTALKQAGLHDPWLRLEARPLHTPRFQPPLHSVHLIPPGQKLLDTSSVPVPVVKSSVLPIIHVPVRLQAGECAHYSIGASLCSDRISGSERAPYPPLDHGLLILTNRRIFYLGKRSQLILAYTHLWYVSLLYNAIALHIEQQFRRIIIELEHPQEWASRIEQLAFIARRTRPQPERPTLLMASLPGLPFALLNAATLKRPALKKPASGQAADSGEAPTRLLLTEYAASNTDEAPTIALTEERTQCAREEAETLELQPSNSSGEDERAPAVQFSDLADITTQDFTQESLLLSSDTQDLSQSPLAGEVVTQELHPETFHALAGIETEEDQAEEPIQTDALGDPALSLAWNENSGEDIDTMPLHNRTDELRDEDVQTIPLRHKRMLYAGRQREDEPVSGRLPDLEITVPRLPRIRPSRFPAYTRNERN